MRMFSKDDKTSLQLLMFKSDNGYTSAYKNWELPFKLRDLKAYLLHPYLSEQEKQDNEFIGVLVSYASDFKKFEKIIELRVKAIISATGWEVNSFVKFSSVDNDYHARLGDDRSLEYDNFVIQEMIKVNNLKVGM